MDLVTSRTPQNSRSCVMISFTKTAKTKKKLQNCFGNSTPTTLEWRGFI